MTAVEWYISGIVVFAFSFEKQAAIQPRKLYGCGVFLCLFPHQSHAVTQAAAY